MTKDLIRICAATSGRLDKVLSAELCANNVSRSQLKRVIESGACCVNGELVLKAGFVVSVGDEIELELIETSLHRLEPFEMDLDIVFEDSELVLINKPAGLVVHPGAGNRQGTLVNALVAHYGEGLSEVGSSMRPGLVHRLDKDTTGLIIVAKTPRAHQSLVEQFAQRRVSKQYCAFALSTPRSTKLFNTDDQGEINIAIGRDERHRVRMAADQATGRPAITRWSVRERLSYGTLLEVFPVTGRTHQIRVHCSAVGAPLHGDDLYGVSDALPNELKKVVREFGRPALHAMQLKLEHPVTQRMMEWRCPLPQDFVKLLERFRQ